MYFVYSLLLAGGLIVALPYFAVQGLRHGKYWPNLAHRMGRLPRQLIEAAEKSPGAIWIHAVSVGEVAAAAALATRLKKIYPKRRLIVSTTTITGQRMARERIAFADGWIYFPLDWAWVVRRFFRAVRPGLVVILEVEIWPNFLRVARRQGVPVIFASARVSERSFARYRRFPGFVRRVLGDASAFLAQTDEDARRLVALGASEETVTVGGNLKFDATAPERNALAEWLEKRREREQRTPIIVAGSVVAGEENAVLDAFAQVRERHPAALLVLAPRKPERFASAGEIAEMRGWGLERRSELDLAQEFDRETGILLLDTIGELAGAYTEADLVFVGGSLAPAGGHNVLEPAALGKPPVFGKHMENFREIARRFLDAGAGVQVATANDLAAAWSRWMDDPGARAAAGSAAKELMEKNRGGLDRVVGRTKELLPTNEAK
jgi:3-deoxy-D-manno-octulosonic-acid transferase